MSRRIAFVITDSGIGGAEKALLSLLNGIDRARFEPVAVIVVKGRREMAGKWAATGVPVQTIGMRRLPTPTGLRRLSIALRAARPDVVHALMFHSIQYARLVKGSSRWALVTSPRVSYRFFPAPARWVDSFLRKGDELAVCESEAGRAELVSRGYPERAVRVAPNGVDPAVYRSDSQARMRVRAAWGATSEELIVGAVGRLNHQKGFDVLIQAASQLKPSGRPWRLVIAGEGPDEPMLRNLAARLNVKVSFLGRQEDIPSALSGFDLYVQSSRFEGLSNALLEAMATGLPCLATSVDGTLDFGRDGENLLLVAPEDATALAAGLDRLLENSGLRAKLAENATITARQRSVGQMVHAFEGAYDAAATHSF